MTRIYLAGPLFTEAERRFNSALCDGLTAAGHDVYLPQRDAPVRVLKVAQFAAALAARLPQAPPGTRVVPPELVWDAAQAADIAAFAADWLNGVPATSRRAHSRAPRV